MEYFGFTPGEAKNSEHLESKVPPKVKKPGKQKWLLTVAFRDFFS